MKTLAALCAAAFVAALLLTPSAFADASFSETESPDDALFHIDIGATFLATGSPPRENNYGVGTIKVSLPGSTARFDALLPIDQTGYRCSITTSAYGEAGTGYLCSTDGNQSGAGLAFPNSVMVHLLSRDCYDPPVDGAPKPAVVEVWAAPSDPGVVPDATYKLVADVGCDDGVGEPPVDTLKPIKCIVPKLKNVPLKRVNAKLKAAGCKRGKVTYVFSRSIGKGRVLKQSQRAGKRMKFNFKINLVVSRGPR